MTRLAPLWQQNNQYPAAADRGMLALLWPTASSSGHAVSKVNNTMNVSIALGSTTVPLASNQGTVLCRSDAAEVVTLQTAPAGGQSRYDLIVCQVRDAALDAGANNDFIFLNVTGVASASPAVPAVPTNAVAIAQVLVPGGVVNLNTATLTDLRSTLYTPADIAGTVVEQGTMPQGRLAYVQRTTDTASVVGEQVVLTTPAITVPANRLIRVVAYARNGICNDPYVQVRLREGTTTAGTQLIDGVCNCSTAGAQINSSPVGMIGYSYSTPPTPGSRQWVFTVVGAGTNACRITAAANTPAWLAVFDDGGL